MIGRINVSADPIRRFNECEDFFKLIINCFLLVAAMKFLKMTSLSDVPSLPHVNQANELWMESAEKRISVLSSVCKSIVEEFLSFEFNNLKSCSDDKVLKNS